MRKILCDRCGQEIPLTSRIGYVAVNWRAPSDESIMYENPYEGYDFCEQCMHDIVEVIDNICTIKTDISVIKAKTPETPEELARKFVDAVKENLSAPEPEEPEEAEIGSEEADTEQEETKMVKPKGWSREKKDIDMGKLGALRRAGWSVHKIADEFGVSIWNAGML